MQALYQTAGVYASKPKPTVDEEYLLRAKAQAKFSGSKHKQSRSSSKQSKMVDILNIPQ
jgi:hypothetical protein